MSLSVIDKYVNKKERDLLDYAKILETIITINDNKMWQKKSEFNTYAKEIISIYAKEYYFTNNTHKDNPIEYSNDNINNVLKSIIKYFDSNDKKSMLRTWKNEIFLMSVIVCTAAYVDFATNIIDGNFNDTKAKFKYLLEYLKKTSILHISDNKYWVSDLFNLIKKNTSEDEKVFACIKSENYHNEYQQVADNIYKVEFVYEIPGLEVYEEKLRNKVLKSYEDEITSIAYEILAFRILEDLISNKEMPTYLINARSNLKRGSTLKAFDNIYFKKYVKVLMPWEMAIEYQEVESEYHNKGISIVYDYEGENNIDSKIFSNNSTILVSKKFMQNNLDNKLAWDRNKIELIIKNKEEN